MNKLPLKFESRDGVNKQLQFAHEGCFYNYTTQASKADEVIPTKEKIVRAQAIIGVHKLYRQEDGTIVYKMLSQFQPHIQKISPSLINMFLPSGLQDWHKKLSKYLMDNFDEL